MYKRRGLWHHSLQFEPDSKWRWRHSPWGGIDVAGFSSGDARFNAVNGNMNVESVRPGRPCS
jgi:hypothetical protein